jgi:hypothetical protein
VLRRLILISIEGHSVADFDTKSAFNFNRYDGEQRRSKHSGFNPHYAITA